MKSFLPTILSALFVLTVLGTMPRPALSACSVGTTQDPKGNNCEDINQGRSAKAVTPDNSNNLPTAPTRALYNGAGSQCDIAVLMLSDGANSVVFKNVQAGSALPISVNRVLVTGTTCTNILAIY